MSFSPIALTRFYYFAGVGTFLDVEHGQKQRAIFSGNMDICIIPSSYHNSK